MADGERPSNLASLGSLAVVGVFLFGVVIKEIGDIAGVEHDVAGRATEDDHRFAQMQAEINQRIATLEAEVLRLGDRLEKNATETNVAGRAIAENGAQVGALQKEIALRFAELQRSNNADRYGCSVR